MKAESSASINQMTKTLLDYGFSKMKAKKLYYKDSVISTIKLYKAKNESIALYSVDDINVLYEDNFDESLIEKSIVLNDDFKAPCEKGSIVGYLLIKYKDQQFKYPLMIKEDVESLKISELLGKYLLEILF